MTMAAEKTSSSDTRKKRVEETIGLIDPKFVKRLKNILRHIKLVQDAAQILGDRLIENGKMDIAKRLIANSFLHDNSKFYGIEWDCLTGDEDTNKHELDVAVTHHVSINPHHPEYWGGIENMPLVFLAEMVCDLYARSVEFGTDLREWIRDVFIKKHNISVNCKIYKNIISMIDLLLNKPFS